MLLIIGILIGANLAIRIVMGEARELRLKGRVAVRGRSRMTASDVGAVVLKGGIFLLVPAAIGHGLDMWFGTTVGTLFG